MCQQHVLLHTTHIILNRLSIRQVPMPMPSTHRSPPHLESAENEHGIIPIRPEDIVANKPAQNPSNKSPERDRPPDKAARVRRDRARVLEEAVDPCDEAVTDPAKGHDCNQIAQEDFVFEEVGEAGFFRGDLEGRGREAVLDGIVGGNCWNER